MIDFTTKILCVGLKTSCLGTTLQDEEATTEVLVAKSANRGSLAVKKTRLPKAMQPFKKLRGEARRFINSMTLPGISPDLRILPASRLATVQQTIAEFQARDEALIKKLVEEYETHKMQDRVDLGDCFLESDYPPRENLSQFFGINLIVCDMPKGDYERVAGLSEAAVQSMQDSHQKLLAEIGASAKSEVYKQLVKLIGHIAEKLSDTNAKAFHESTFTNLTEYLALVPDLNITNDPELAAMATEAKEKLSLSMRIVKDSQFLRADAAEKAKDILKRFGAQGSGRKLLGAA